MIMTNCRETANMLVNRIFTVSREIWRRSKGIVEERKVSVAAAESASLGSDPQHTSVCKEKFLREL